MISYYSEFEFQLKLKTDISYWLMDLISKEGKETGDISYIFCEDQYLTEINVKYLKHNTLTDVISFDYGMGELIGGDIFISIERIVENATLFGVTFEDELHRVMAHGVLHFCGYSDKTTEEKKIMRIKEDYYLSLRSFL